jgi:hypothetical protein
MEATTVATAVARVRIAIGIAAVVVPGPAVELIGARSGPNGLAPLLARMVGTRDIALGLGTIVALDRGTPVRGWLEGSALADAGDCIASVLARRSMTPRAFRATAGVAAGSAILGALLGRRLDPPPPPHPGHPEAIATGHPATVAGG